MIRTFLCLVLILPLISACGIVRTAVGTTVDIVTIPVDLLTMQEVENDDVADNYAMISNN